MNVTQTCELGGICDSIKNAASIMKMVYIVKVLNLLISELSKISNKIIIECFIVMFLENVLII